MKVKHYDMVVAKAANFELVQLMKINKVWEVVGSNCSETINFSSDYDYFLCLPKHTDAVLEKLNGGECQLCNDVDWIDANSEQFDEWGDIWWYMCDKYESRIKPKKEKRWIAVTRSGNDCLEKLFDSKESAKKFIVGFYPNNLVSDFQFIEVEVEVF